MSNKIYPIGIQNFEKIRNDGYFYIDKTALMYQMVKTGSYYFLSRPRRFGKSLLISTLEAYFQGKKELFTGLAVERLEKDWIKYPILHLDLNIEKYDTPESLDNILEKSLTAWEKLYGAEPSERSFSLRFAGIIERACKQAGQRVVILVDEYDKPMLQAIGNEKLQKQFRDTVTVNGYTLADGLLTVDFGESYNVLNPQVEVLCRTAVVCTLNQIDGVDYVAFTIGGVPYGQTGDDKTVTAMKASDFISGLRGDLADKNKDDFKLYFANKKATKLKEYNLKNASYSGKSKEQFIVEQLIKGPQKGKYTATLTSDTELISVATAGNICYVDFGDNFLTEQSTVSNKLVIYSIVNSLLELDNIHKVQISVEGDSALKYHDDISLAEPFIRNLDLVEQKNK